MTVPCGLSDLLFGLLDLMDQLDSKAPEHAPTRRILLRAFDDLSLLGQQPQDSVLDVELVAASPTSSLLH